MLLLSVVTAWIEALNVSGNTFLYACAKEDCRHWAQPHFDTFHQLLIIVEPILSKTCDTLAQASATYGTHAKRGTWNDFQWHAEWIEIQYMIS
jgi:hypothetical protein